ncbi:MAG: outer membrane protein assembly factor BamC [Gammaproteobacteria bacterium]|nr:outer membrane protein assembly factor BamC [Gammaproteobacteria bacterium]
MSLKVSKLVLFSLILTLLAACNSMPNMEEMLPDRKVEYKKSKQAEKNLEVPPDLSSSSISDSLVIPGAQGSGSATYSDFANRDTPAPGARSSGGVIPQLEDIRVQRDGDQRWLVVKASPDDVWARVIDFWQENGILMVEQDPSVGVMVTDWIENRADIKSDFITDSVRKLFDGVYSSSTRDQFRVRVEHGGDAGTVELFLTHRGMQEELVTSTGSESERTVWTPRATDHGLEAEMLRRLMVHLGVADQKASKSLARKGASASQRSKLNRGRDSVSLLVNEELPRAWRLVGVALDRVGFAVEDRNRSEGIYFVRYNDPMKENEDPGILSKLAFWQEEKNIDKENRYQVKLSPEGSITQIIILNEAGTRDNSATAVRILTLLHEQMR